MIVVECWTMKLKCVKCDEMQTRRPALWWWQGWNSWKNYECKRPPISTPLGIGGRESKVCKSSFSSINHDSAKFRSLSHCERIQSFERQESLHMGHQIGSKQSSSSVDPVAKLTRKMFALKNDTMSPQWVLQHVFNNFSKTWVNINMIDVCTLKCWQWQGCLWWKCS